MSGKTVDRSVAGLDVISLLLCKHLTDNKRFEGSQVLENHVHEDCEE